MQPRFTPPNFTPPNFTQPSFTQPSFTQQWPLGVFASIDAGLGVHLDVAQELGVPTIQLHAPAAKSRTAENAARFLERLAELNITITAVFGVSTMKVWLLEMVVLSISPSPVAYSS